MPKETYYSKMVSKHLEEFLKKHEKVEDLETLEKLEKALFFLPLVDSVNDLDARLRKLEQKTEKKTE